MQDVLASPVQARKREDWLERAALGASFLCLVHCLALPILIAALPALSRFLDVPESFHVWMLAFVVPASATALLSGRARHGAAWPLGIGGVGLLLLGAGALLVPEGAAETVLTISGSLALAAAHVGNWRLRHTCSAHL